MKSLPVIVTGASGFIGRHTLACLADYPAPVLAVDRVEPAGAGLARAVRFHQSDLSGPSDLVPPDFDVSAGFALVHLAWDMRRGSAFAPQLEQARMLAALLDHWSERGLQHVIGMGSAEEYGTRSGRIHEYDPPVFPLSPYGMGKHAAFMLASSWAARHGKDLLWLRPFVVYGAGQGGDMMIPYAVGRARAGEPAEFTDGQQERDLVYVDDLVAAIVASLDRGLSGTHVVNIGCGSPVKVREVLLEIARLLNAESLFRLGARPRRPGEPERQVADIGAARDLLGWTPKTDWRDGIGKMVNERIESA